MFLGENVGHEESSALNNGSKGAVGKISRTGSIVCTPLSAGMCNGSGFGDQVGGDPDLVLACTKIRIGTHILTGNNYGLAILRE